MPPQPSGSGSSGASSMDQELVSLFNSLKAAASPQDKHQSAKAIEEVLLTRSPHLLPQYLDDVLHLASEPSAEIKGWVCGFVERVLESPHLRATPLPFFAKLGQTLLYLLAADRTGSVRRALSVTTAYCQKLQPFLVKHGREKGAELESWEKLWSATASSLRRTALKVLRQCAEPERVKPQCYALLKELVLLYSPRPSDSAHLERITPEGTLQRLPQRPAGLDARMLEGNLIL
eukprot:RCo003943